MNEQSQCAVGIDVGTENVRAVVLEVRDDGEAPNVIGYGEIKNSGMRKGTVANLVGPKTAVDNLLAGIEKMIGMQVNVAHVSVNGSHLKSEKTDGMITLVGSQEVKIEDIDRINDAATLGRIDGNRRTLSIVPLNYKLDGQSGIRDPLGMSGVRLEMSANVVSGLAPSCDTLVKAVNMASVDVAKLIPTAVAAAHAVLTEQQMEDGVAVIDIGAATTSVAVFDEGNLQFVGVAGVGSNNITKDLAIGLETDMELAESVKRKYVTAYFEAGDKDIMLKQDRQNVVFSRDSVNQIAEDRLVDIFEQANRLLRAAGYAQRLPAGIVLVGGGVKMQGIAAYAKKILRSPVRIGKPGDGLKGLVSEIEKPEYSVAVGLALIAAEDGSVGTGAIDDGGEKKGFFGRLFHPFH